MTKLNEIQEYRKLWKSAKESYDILLNKYSWNKNIINQINIIILKIIIKKLKRNIDKEINKIRERKD